MAAGSRKRAARGGKGSDTQAHTRRKLRIHSDDRVIVISGKDRGKSGRVLRVEPANERVYVEGLNMVKRHTRPQGSRSNVSGQDVGAQLGGVIEREGPIHVSNVMLLDPKGSKPTRVGVEREDGKPFRVSRRTGARID
ncbi:MAG TPA: 50S ribosomal protein L24 [Solirubrobacteraceae bacterium]|jgi:large subunit ribosomal protein L24|nr:50S ribosomal protein L24 [Solirubrobacteraceae bacterium]